MHVPIVEAGSSMGPEPPHASDHQGYPEGITTSATAIIPFSGCAVQTLVTLSLKPLHLGACQVRLLVYPAILLIDLTLIVYTIPGPGRRT